MLEEERNTRNPDGSEYYGVTGISGAREESRNSGNSEETTGEAEESEVTASGLVYIGRIISIDPIPGADRIELATAVCGHGGKWSGIVQKGWYRVSHLCLVYLQDSLLPHTPDFEFMAKYKHRVRMQRFKTVPSECLIMPLTIEGNLGDDVTAEAGVKKYVKLLPPGMRGHNRGNFPWFIPKTDEVNFQKVPNMVDNLRGTEFYATVKADGTSTTAYRYENHFGVCSRNWEKVEGKDNTWWVVANKYGVKEKLPEDCALQWETVGPGIQKNPLGLHELEGRAFDLWLIKERRYGTWEELQSIADYIGMPTVELIEHGNILSMDDEALRVYAEGKYPNGRQREGVVLRACDGRTFGGERVSFKVINLRYKD